MRNHHSRKGFFALILCLLTFTATALPSDNKKPIYVVADTAHLNKTQGMGIFSGHVQLTQGSSILKADILTLYTNEKGTLVKAVAKGKAASYRTVTDPSKPPFVATADNIVYLVSQAKIILQGHAKASQGQNSYNAPVLEYQTDQKVVSSPSSLQGRTTIIIQPKSFYSTKE